MFERYLRLIYPYFAPPDTPSGGMGDEEREELTRDLADLEDIGEEGKGKPDPKSEEEEDDELVDKDKEDLDKDDDDKLSDKEDEDEDKDKEDDKDKEEKDDEEDKDEPKDLGTMPRYSEINKKFPGVFKEFPQLRSALFLAPKYQEIFPDPEAAREAANKSQEYDEMEAEIVGKGDAGYLLNTLAENNPKALKAVVESFGEALRKAAPEQYTTLTTPIIEELLAVASAHAQKTNNKNLHLAARHLANFVFANGGDIPDPSRRVKPGPSEAEKQLEEERASYAKRELDRALADIGKEASPELNRIISDKLTGLSDFEKRALIREVREEVDTRLNADKAFQNVMAGLWRRAAASGYSDASKSRIKRAWLDRARAIAPSVRNRLREEALGAKDPGREKRKDGDQKKRTFPSSGGGVSGSNKSRSGFADPKKIDWSKTTDEDILA